MKVVDALQGSPIDTWAYSTGKRDEAEAEGMQESKVVSARLTAGIYS